MDNEPMINPMPTKRIIETLNELRTTFRHHTPSKYYFALGYAIKAIEAKIEEPVQAVSLENGVSIKRNT